MTPPARLKAATMAIAAAAAIWSASPAAAAPAGPPGDRTVLFQSGIEACYHVPAIVRTAHGTLIAMAEQRFGYNPAKAQRFRGGDVVPFATGPVKGCADSGNTNIVLRVSRDGGRSWSPARVLVDHNAFLAGGYHLAAAQNPTLVADARSVTLVFAVLRSAGDRNEPNCLHVTAKKQATCGAQTEQGLWAVTSQDDGSRWSAPRPVQTGLNPYHLNRPGPGHGIVIGNRLVVPSYSGLLLSDDGGRNWAVGATTDKQQLDGGEAAVAALPNGTLWSFQRPGKRSYAASPDKGGMRVSAYSSDRGMSFGRVQADTRFPMPPVSASVLGWSSGLFVSYPAPAGPIGQKVVYTDRSRMTVAFSGDGGASWRRCLVDPGSSSYSDLAGIDAETVALVYEGAAVAGSPDPKGFVQALVLRRLPIAWLRTCGSHG